MQEIKEKRTLTQKHFLRDDGKRVLRAYAGHVHYFNKNGVGDGVQEFREIDMSLNWNDEKRGWEFLYHSFNPLIPEFADEWADFNDYFDEKNQSISYRARCAHIAGRLTNEFNDQMPFGAVIYDNAFGEGIDLIYGFTRTQMLKLVRIRDGYKPTTDQSYDFTVKLSDPTMRVMRSYNDGNEYELDITKPKTFDSARSTRLIKRELPDVTNKRFSTYLRAFKAWDSNPDSEQAIREIIEVDLMMDEEGVFFRKHITADLLSRSFGDVFTDTTTSYDAHLNDGSVLNRSNVGAATSSSTWDEFHDETTGEAIQEGSSNADVGIGHNGKYYGYRYYANFDTSGIPDTDEISDALIGIYINTVTDNDPSDSDSVFTIVRCIGTPDTGANSVDYFDDVGTSDGSAGTAMNTPQQKFIDDFDMGSLTASAFNEFDVNETGLGYISKTGYTKIGIREGHDTNDAFPNSAALSRWTQATQESSNVPYIEVTYAPAAADQNSNFLMMM